MSKASRRNSAGRKRKLDVARQPDGRPSGGVAAQRMREFVLEARARKSAITGRDDLPVDVLGIMLGRGVICDDDYQEGRKLERLMARLYGSPVESASAMFREAVSPQNDEEAVAVVEPMTDEAATALFMKMNRILMDRGIQVRDWVVAAVRYNRFPDTRSVLRFNSHVAMIVEGLEALSAHRKPRDRETHEMVCKAA
jgi:hypothetical protein